MEATGCRIEVVQDPKKEILDNSFGRDGKTKSPPRAEGRSMLFYCGGTKEGVPCAFPSVGSGDQAASEPIFPRRCPRCGAEPITWLRAKPVAMKKPILQRLGAGWQCATCREWVTGAFHFCVPVRNPAAAGALVRLESDYQELKNAILSVSKQYANDLKSNSRPELVSKQLETLANLHRWAPWLGSRADEWLRQVPDSEAYDLFVQIEDTIRHYFTSGDSLIPVAQHAQFSMRILQLQDRLEEGWVRLKSLWQHLVDTKDSEAQRFLVCEVGGLNHEKGYHHVLLDLQEMSLLKSVA